MSVCVCVCVCVFFSEFFMEMTSSSKLQIYYTSYYWTHRRSARSVNPMLILKLGHCNL